MYEKIKKTVLTFFLLYIAIVAGLYVFQRNLIYYPDKNKPDLTAYVSDGISAVSAQTPDGLTLSAWYKPPEGDKETLIMFHGNASNHLGNLYQAMPYIHAGYGFLSAGYRGYNGDAGKPTEQGLYDDARTWINFLKTKTDEDKIVFYGQSLGSGVAVQMATEFQNVKALILEAPYTSLPDVAFTTYFFVPVHLLMKDRYNSRAKIKDIKAPLLIMQGTRDQIIPPRLGQRLFDAANEPKEIEKFDGYGHNNLPVEEMAAKSMKFINEIK